VERVLADALGQDVTKIAAEEKQRLLSRLLARLAHEIRNPLSSLAIHVQLLEEDMAQASPPLMAKAAGRFEIIRSELSRLENLMRQFLSLAAPSSVDLHTINVAEVVGYVCELLRPEAATRGIEVVMSVPEGLPPLTADPAQLKQALINLVINAIDAMREGGRLQVRVDKSGDKLTLEVSDTGPGIPVSERDRVLDRFSHGKATHAAIPRRFGLGLALVADTAERLGGELAVSSELGHGTSMTIRLPRLL